MSLEKESEVVDLGNTSSHVPLEEEPVLEENEVDELKIIFDDINELESDDLDRAASLYQDLIFRERGDDFALKIKEQALYRSG